MSNTPIYDATVGALLVDDPLAADIAPVVVPAARPAHEPGRHHLRTARRLMPGEPALSGLHDPFHDLTERTAMAPPEPEQDDLSAYDPPLESTEKTSGADVDVEQPPQDPDWVPPNAGSTS